MLSAQGNNADKADAKESAKTLHDTTKEIQDFLAAIAEKLDSNDLSFAHLCAVRVHLNLENTVGVLIVQCTA